MKNQLQFDLVTIENSTGGAETGAWRFDAISYFYVPPINRCIRNENGSVGVHVVIRTTVRHHTRRRGSGRLTIMTIDYSTPSDTKTDIENRVDTGCF